MHEIELAAAHIINGTDTLDTPTAYLFIRRLECDKLSLVSRQSTLPPTQAEGVKMRHCN